MRFCAKAQRRDEEDGEGGQDGVEGEEEREGSTWARKEELVG